MVNLDGQNDIVFSDFSPLNVKQKTYTHDIPLRQTVVQDCTTYKGWKCYSLPNLHCNETGPKITTKSVSILCYLTMGTTGPELMYLRRSPKNGLEDNAA